MMKFTHQAVSWLFFSTTVSANSIRGGSSSSRTRRTPEEEHPCHNYPGWHDSRSWNLDCEWYEASPEGRCDDFGNRFAGVAGLTANEACCVCGGGFGFVSGPTTITSTDINNEGGRTLCMTIDGEYSTTSPPTSGSNVIMDICDGRTSQDWIVDEPPEGSAFTPRAVFIIKSSTNPQLCLDADRRSGNGNGDDTVTNLYVYDCKGPGRSGMRFNQEFDLGLFCESNKLLNKADYCLNWVYDEDYGDNIMNVIGEHKAGGGACCPDHSPEFKFVR